MCGTIIIASYKGLYSPFVFICCLICDLQVSNLDHNLYICTNICLFILAVFRLHMTTHSNIYFSMASGPNCHPAPCTWRKRHWVRTHRYNMTNTRHVFSSLHVYLYIYSLVSVGTEHRHDRPVWKAL